MSEAVDHYHTLGLPPDATASQIKSAYHTAAKRAHPDAGGHAAAMEQVNEAYRVLSDPDLRREYDFQRAADHSAVVAATHDHSNATPHHEPPVPSSEELARAAAEHHHRRMAAARASAWSIFSGSAVTTVLLITVTAFFAAQITNATGRIILAAVSFIPVYGTLLGAIFLVIPEMRLNAHDIAYDLARFQDPRKYLTTAEVLGVVVLLLSALPLSAAWVFFLWGKIIHP